MEGTTETWIVRPTYEPAIENFGIRNGSVRSNASQCDAGDRGRRLLQSANYKPNIGVEDET